jgi:hypothetical protein
MSKFEQRLKKLEERADDFMRLHELGKYKGEREKRQAERQSRVRVNTAILEWGLNVRYEKKYKNMDDGWSKAIQEQREWLRENWVMQFFDPEMLPSYEKLCARKLEGDKKRDSSEQKKIENKGLGSKIKDEKN